MQEHDNFVPRITDLLGPLCVDMPARCRHDVLDLLISICSSKGLDWPPHAPANMNAAKVAGAALAFNHL
jgi:hypothetical protein